METIEQVKKDMNILASKVETLINLLKQTTEIIDIAIGVELEYADYKSVEKLKALKREIETEVEICK